MLRQVSQISYVRQLFVDQAKAMFEAPALSQDLDSMSAAWKSMPHVWGLLLWCSMLGLVVFAILLFGTWAPVRGAETASTFIPMLLTGVWSYPVLKWVQALGALPHWHRRSPAFCRTPVCRHHGCILGCLVLLLLLLWLC